MDFKKVNKRELAAVMIGVLVITAVTCYPFFREGLFGYEPDYMYHLLRIEGVKDALLSGHYPAYIYTNFFEGEGYGSPMFYPDIFLVPAALLRILGMAPLAVYKAYAAILCLIASLSTYFSLKYMTGHYRISLTGTFLLMLSEFYLADLVVRNGYSGYISYIFIPILLAGIYDFFERGGKKTWLLGVAFGGLILSHTINTLLGFTITVVIFLFMLFRKKGREAIFDKGHLLRLVITALVTFLAVSWYLLPLMEQMKKGGDFVYQHPWAFVSTYVQPFLAVFYPTGYFFNIAYVGLGIPVFAAVFVLILAYVYGRWLPDGGWGMGFFLAGVILTIIMTPAFPWKLMDHTVFNSLQFTFRIYPYALAFLVCGLCILASRLWKEYEKKADDRQNVTRVLTCLPALMIALCIGCGIWQNSTVLSGEFKTITEETLLENTTSVGKGEWLPFTYIQSISPLQEVYDRDDLMKTPLAYVRNQAEGGGSFEIPEGYDASSFLVPNIYYIGYQAQLVTEQGNIYQLEPYCTDVGLVGLDHPAGESGIVTLVYEGTSIQKISRIATLVTWIAIVALLLVKNKFSQFRNV